MNQGIDSFKIRIPIDKVNVINPFLEEYVYEVTANQMQDFVETGEIPTEEFKLKAHRVTDEYKCITTRYMIKRGNHSVEYDSVVIGLNSKLFASPEYFKGITKDNIKKIHSFIMSQSVIECSFDDFLDGFATDVDIKSDMILKSCESHSSHELQVKLVRLLQSKTKSSQSIKKGCDPKTSPKNTGIQWSVRKLATNANPYIKFYAKDIELENKSNIFFDKYLGYAVDEGYSRVEGTIKNKSHYNYIKGIKDDKKDFTLRELLEFTPSDIDNILKSMSSKHMSSLNKKEVEKEGIPSLGDVFCMAYLDTRDSMGLAKSDIAKYCSNKDQVYNARKKIDAIWKAEIEQTEKGKVGNELDKALRLFDSDAE